MKMLLESLLLALILSNLVLLGSTRVRNYVKVIALQGFILGLLTLLLHLGALSIHTLLLSGGSILLKSLVFPWLLIRAIREADVHASVEPFVGYNASLIIGVLLLPFCFWLASRLPAQLMPTMASSLPIALFTMASGLFLIVARKKALTQVVGYLVLENGIYVSALALVGEIPWIVELGVLLDIFVAVFVMGIALYQINREFDHIYTDQLSSLKG
ncbi:MAG: hydrogenase [Cyanobacteria bacterium NC_groundwater_1444_Ag_S-0.65um_54_12]|nr:hydrogenase [Cyanobacteria bacterium NC_groundwater_1444_Ag_S-0.65um_54_12]